MKGPSISPILAYIIGSANNKTHRVALSTGFPQCFTGYNVYRGVLNNISDVLLRFRYSFAFTYKYRQMLKSTEKTDSRSWKFYDIF